MQVMPVLEIHNLCFRFSSNAPWFFNNLSLAFSPGTIHFVRGNNGIGKSTLFRIMRGVFGPSEQVGGSIVLDGIVVSLSKEQHNNLNALSDSIKMVQQKFDTMLADKLSFAHNLQMVSCARYPGLARLPKITTMPHMLERFLADTADKPVSLLSGGQRQILAILMVLQKPTKILLLDEPTAALDHDNATMVMTFLQELVRTLGLTVLIICHDRELVLTYAPHGYFELQLDAATMCRTVVYKN